VFGIDFDAIMWVAFAIPLIALWVAAYWDLVFRSDLPIPRKVVWGAFIFFTAYIGIAFYFLSRPTPQPTGKDGADSTGRTSALVAELEQLSTAHANGEITDDDYLASKRTLLGLTSGAADHNG